MIIWVSSIHKWLVIVMYNENVKKRFLEEYLHQKQDRRCEWIFSKLGDAYEKSHDKDLAEMSFSEAKAAIESTGIEENGTIRTAISIVKAYTEWCEKNEIFHCVPGGFKKLSAKDIDLSESLKKVLFKDDTDLIESIKEVRTLDDGYSEVAILALSWIGLTREEISALRDNDVDLENRIVYGKSGEIIAMGFSALICDVLHRYVKCRVSSRGNGLTEMEVVKDLSVDSFLKKMCPRGSKKFGTEYSNVQIASQVNKLAVKYEDLGHPRRHTITNVWRSGRFHKLWEIEQTGVDISARENRSIVEEVFRNKKNYYNAIRMYKWYRHAFYE